MKYPSSVDDMSPNKISVSLSVRSNVANPSVSPSHTSRVVIGPGFGVGFDNTSIVNIVIAIHPVVGSSTVTPNDCGFVMF